MLLNILEGTIINIACNIILSEGTDHYSLSYPLAAQTKNTTVSKRAKLKYFFRPATHKKKPVETQQYFQQHLITQLRKKWNHPHNSTSFLPHTSCSVICVCSWGATSGRYNLCQWKTKQDSTGEPGKLLLAEAEKNSKRRWHRSVTHRGLVTLKATRQHGGDE